MVTFVNDVGGEEQSIIQNSRGEATYQNTIISLVSKQMQIFDKKKLLIKRQEL